MGVITQKRFSLSLASASRAAACWKDGEMLIHARRRALPMLAVSLIAGVCLFGGLHTRAQSSGNLPPAAEEPWLAEPGNYYADFNEAQIACYKGSMRACDLI